MNLDKFIVFSKCVAFVLGSFCVNLGTSLGQWSNSGVGPNFNEWAVILLGASGSAFLAYVSFTSRALGDYQRKLALTRGERDA